ncbi:hypothetical protein CXF83_03110 [Shewanella sp. Choline-02u-19]|uniref:hypothetical protein n=1 Tax=unclassified Shewanella TaxID=196818 RepID=UPI000C34DEF1|nr:MULTISPECIES: hypothetical protein [unclassified Shewanella]PKH57229.1 hypothetical protein CXF84_09645 [Shewanella sp. Bg11-22]PKI29657.1 hypothetical protein CXF83_03110 [Shewanella sp. Choline-02u-19]
MTQPLDINYWHLSSTQDQRVTTWSKVLIAQHIQLKSEITNITSLLSQPTFCIFKLDAKLRRLIKGVKTHLQLEHTFFTPVLSQLNITSNQRHRLTEGYEALFDTCESTAKLVHSLKISLNNTPLSRSHIKEIEGMFYDIRARLADEDIAYSMIDILEEQHA